MEDDVGRAKVIDTGNGPLFMDPDPEEAGAISSESGTMCRLSWRGFKQNSGFLPGWENVATLGQSGLTRLDVTLDT